MKHAQPNRKLIKWTFAGNDHKGVLRHFIISCGSMGAAEQAALKKMSNARLIKFES